ncbi:hypothetical protein OSB04_002658 [Centaurea solstitialis]|uniref:Uncharacterized protein n=1 Tax=Centaurea solstitialis TaxID=347529 RepID=A0AA38WN01_9ASTR|nr:hypothetical protein OSB04_002658 [Centaurea solstitialis]
MEKQTSDLYYVVQKSGETIRDYFNTFNAAMIEVKNCDVKTAIEAYKRGLDDSSGLYLELTKYPPENFDDVRSRTLAFMRIKDDALFRRKHSNEKKPLSTSKDLVDSLRKIDANVRWLKKSENPSKDKDQNRWCDFHEDHGHTTDECISLKKEVSYLKSKGHLKGIILDEHGRPASPVHTKVVNCITGGSEVCGLTYSAAKRHAREGLDEHPIPDEVKSKAEKEIDAMTIAFDQDDTQGVHHKHHDALVIQLTIENCSTKRILIDGGSSANVIFADTLKVMGIERSKIVRRSTTLIGFNGDSMNTLGEIILPVFAKGINKQTKFNVIDCQSAYNVILGKPWIHEMKAVPSTYHQKIKFPSPWGIQEIAKQDGKRSDDDLQLEEIVLDPEHPDRKIFVGASLSPDIKNTIISFLQEHSDCFAWSHEDMVGIDPSIISHKLNVDPTFKPIKQKRRKFAPERNKVINDEVNNLLKTGKIREVKYPNWLANMVVVQKKNRKWRVCIDFTDLKKACPKDPFPLPHIDAMVDATAGHELLTFMDAYSGYNQILMHTDDQEKTAFMTDKGIYCYKVMPFGLKNAGSTYQRLVNMMFKEHLGRMMEVYIDEMLVKLERTIDHVDHLKQSFDILRQYKMKLNPTKCSFGVRAGKFLGYLVTQRGIEASPKQNQGFQWTDDHEKALQDLKQYMVSPPLLTQPVEGESLQLYLAVSNNTTSAVLVREEDQQQRPIYYVSKSFLDAETRYTSMEKLLLGLVTAAKKLRHYFQSHHIITVTNYPLTTVLRKPELTGRLAKWCIYLSGFDIEFKPKTAIKSQALADYVAEFSPGLEPTTCDEVHNVTIQDNQPWLLYVDGSSIVRGVGLGVVLKSSQGGNMMYSIRCEFKAMNNEAEYEALIAGLDIAHKLGANHMNVRSDSLLVVNQVNGDFQAKDSKMMSYLKVVKERVARFDHFSIEQIPRDLNTQADALANLGSAFNDPSMESIHILHLTTPTIEIKEEVQMNKEIYNWSLDIWNYLKHDHLPEDKMEARKTRSKASRFGVPSEIMCNNGSQFISEKTRTFYERRGINLVTSTPRYPQSNGLVESSNKVIINSIRKRLKGAKGKWVEELPSVLWANRTTPRASTRQTPYSLVYGCEAVLPIEAHVPVARNRKLIIISNNCPPLRKSEIEYYAMIVGVHHYNGHVLSDISFDGNRRHQDRPIMDNGFIASLQQQLQQANDEIQRLRVSQGPSMPIPPPYPPQHLRPPLRPQFNASVPLSTVTSSPPPMPQGPPAFTFGPFNNISQQIPIPGHIPIAASSTIHTTIPPSTGISSGLIPTIPTTIEDPLNVRLKSLEEQNQKLFALLTKLPGAAVPVEVEPKTGFQALPFVDEISLIDVPKKYTIPAFATKYSGVTDPVEHVAQYKQLMWTVPIPAQFQEVCMCKSFGSTLTGAALLWLINLKPKSIGSFAELVNQFTRQFASSRKMEKQTSDLYYVVQKPGETIRDYFNRFNAAMIEVKNCDVKTAIEAYKRGLEDSSGLYLELTKYLPENFDDPKKSDKPNKDKDQNKWCDFHEDHGYTTDECISLKKEISYLKSKGHLKGVIPEEQGRPASPVHTKVVNCITGGSEVCGLTYFAAKRHARDGPDERPIPEEIKSKVEKELDAMTITFDKDDTQGVHHKHHDALVIQLTIGNCSTKRILIDGGSSANVIFADTLKVMGIERSEIVRRSTTLIGFNGDPMNTLGEIILPVFAKGINKQTKFNVVDCQSAYNVILGRPWIHEMKAVPSTYHQKIKFPSPWGIQEIASEKKEHSECFAWSYEDMVGIDPNVISHKLNVDPTFKPIKQKRRKFAPERNKVINDEVDNLLKTGKIREVKYPE